MTVLSEENVKQIIENQLTIEVVESQIERFKTGFPAMGLVRAASIGDGILQLNQNEISKWSNYFQEHCRTLEIVKFIPASGAASRMFKSLFGFMNSQLGKTGQGRALIQDNDVTIFFQNLSDFAFYPELESRMIQDGLNITELVEDGHYAEVLEYLLAERGLNYGNLPKGLLSFHRYENGHRTPVEEHLVEGAKYARGLNDTVKIHFTVSDDHMTIFKSLVDSLSPQYEKLLKSTFDISYSTQNPSTDTIAVNPDNTPFKNDDGSLVFRPAGHGALLDNLNQLESDIIFIKNIDNVVPDAIKQISNEYKMALGGLIIHYQAKIFKYLANIDSMDEASLDELGEFLRNDLNIELEESIDRRLVYKTKLDRPLRICGMVVNTGEAGGGPFWCKNADKSVSLQIVETSQIDFKDQNQLKILQSSSHFNPVDVVVSNRRYDGTLFDLMNFQDSNTGFISSKSKDGQELKAMELPGLWNGGMSDWNTILVEVPAITFNPVKTVNDLLRPEHQ